VVAVVVVVLEPRQAVLLRWAVAVVQVVSAVPTSSPFHQPQTLWSAVVVTVVLLAP
jgi:hypothetical protein